MPALRLVVGLGNPTPRYEKTRHNAGFWFVDALAKSLNAPFAENSRLGGAVAKIQAGGSPAYLLKPMTYMNRSGQSVASVASYYKIAAGDILVAHDELDLPAGVVRLKKGGGHGGHNGLRDIIACLGSHDFHRLRIGIGHPGSRPEVTDFVLGTPGKSEECLLVASIQAALDESPSMLEGDLQAVMNRLNSRSGKRVEKKIDAA